MEFRVLQCDLILIVTHFAAALSDKENANGGQSTETDADQYFEPLEMACQTRQPRLMEIALNAIHYLVGNLYRTVSSLSSFFFDVYLHYRVRILER